LTSKHHSKTNWIKMFRFKAIYLIRLFCNMHGHNVNMQGMVCFEVKNWGNYIEVYCRKREKKSRKVAMHLTHFCSSADLGDVCTKLFGTSLRASEGRTLSVPPKLSSRLNKNTFKEKSSYLRLIVVVTFNSLIGEIFTEQFCFV